MELNPETVTAVALGVGLAAAAGFRVFVPMLVASIAAHAGILPVQDGFAWLASWPAMVCFGTATVLEIVAYYVPFVDNLLDSITTPMAVGAGTLLLTSVLPIDSDMLKWTTGFIIGGGIAAAVQGGSVLARLLSSGLTGGGGNNAVATGENAAAVGTSLLSLVAPLVVVPVLLVVIVVLIVLLKRRLFRARRTAL
ncbi:MAG: DUF4126 domain-containing protein [Dehalococcoidia bacterium]|nr:DUF4126 domain-containing protein [Dehalococcoidia bacterium]